MNQNPAEGSRGGIPLRNPAEESCRELQSTLKNLKSSFPVCKSNQEYYLSHEDPKESQTSSCYATIESLKNSPKIAINQNIKHRRAGYDADSKSPWQPNLNSLVYKRKWIGHRRTSIFIHYFTRVNSGFYDPGMILLMREHPKWSLPAAVILNVTIISPNLNRES